MNIRKSVILACLLLVGCKSVNRRRENSNLEGSRGTQSWVADLGRIQSAIERLRALDHFPDYSDRETSIQANKSDAPEVYRSPFERISTYIFRSKRPVQIILCEGADLDDCDSSGGAMFRKKNMAVLVSANAPSNPVFRTRDAVAFVMAHEMSHYLAEVIVTLDGKSPNGFPSILDDNSQLGSNLRDQMLVGGMAHAEIDAFALVIMRALNWPTTGILNTLRAGEISMAADLKKMAENDPSLGNLPNPETIRLRSMEALLQ